eukprot:ANDGO_04217.mRNA.1 hypothetical protein GUITHDRAFT_102332
MSTTYLLSAQRYIDLSNSHDLDGIEQLLSPRIVYISESLGRFEGPEAVMQMMRSFFSSFQSVFWTIQGGFKHRQYDSEEDHKHFTEENDQEAVSTGKCCNCVHFRYIRHAAGRPDAVGVEWLCFDDDGTIAQIHTSKVTNVEYDS